MQKAYPGTKFAESQSLYMSSTAYVGRAEDMWKILAEKCCRTLPCIAIHAGIADNFSPVLEALFKAHKQPQRCVDTEV